MVLKQNLTISFDHFLSKIDPNRPPCTIETTNNFPTAAGLASSSSGFAALALAALAASERTMTTTEASILARQGSGSACRSLWGGFVGWDLGNRIDGTDCHGYPIAGPDHWDVAMVMAIVSSGKKAIGSTEAMIRTAKTSPLYEPFVTQAPQDVVRATTAIHQKDLKTLGEIMESSTFKMHASMHAATILYWKPATVAYPTVLEPRLMVPAYLTMDAAQCKGTLYAKGCSKCPVRIATTRRELRSIDTRRRPRGTYSWVIHVHSSRRERS